MVFQLKSAPRANKTSFKRKIRKSFEDDSGQGDESNVQMKKTRKGKQSLRTPKGKKVVFHISGNTPGNKTAKASDVGTPNSVTAKKQFTPERKGKNEMKEFQGRRTSFNLSNKNGKVLKDEELNSEDDDDDDDDDFDLDLCGDEEEDDNDQETEEKDDGKRKTKGGGDDDEDDDNEDDEQETEEKDDGKGKTKGVIIKENSPKKNTQISPKNKAEKFKTPAKISEKVTKHKNKTSVKNLKIEGGETMCNLKDEPVQENEGKTHVKRAEVAGSEKIFKTRDAWRQETLVNYMESKREREMQSLFIGNLPRDITPEDIKAWSSDILQVELFRDGFRGSKTRCAFILFASEKKAEENYALLQGKNVRGSQITVDFDGEKSKNKKRKNGEKGATINLKKLFVRGLATDVTIDKVANIFPKAFQITLNQNPMARVAHVCYSSAELAAAEYEAGKYAGIDGKPIRLDFSSENERDKSEREGEMRSLFIGHLPLDITPEDILAWSSDIFKVMLQDCSGKSQRRCAIIVFGSEKKARENYALLQGKRVRDSRITVDYVGEKSKHIKRKNDVKGAMINLTKIFVRGLATHVTIDKVANIFPKAFQITLNRNAMASFKVAEVCYSSAELAAAEYEAGKYAGIDGKPIRLDFSSENMSFDKYKREREMRTLFIGSLPFDITPEDIKALSSDILEVMFPDQFNSRSKRRAFVLFASVKKAEENYDLLKGKNVRGGEIIVDYAGKRSEHRKRKNNESVAEINVKDIFVSKLAADVTIDKVANIFPKAFQITLNGNAMARVGYASAELAAAEYEAGKNAKIDGKLIQVQYWDNKKRTSPFKTPFAKRFKSEEDKFR